MPNQLTEMNEALMISSLRQHELTEAAERLNAELQREIAERKRAQEASFLLASIVEGSNDSIISITFDQIITSWNQGAARLYGYSAAEVVGKSLSMLTLPEDLILAWSRVEKVRRGEKVDSFEIERQQKDGHHMWVSVTLSAIRDDAGTPIGISTVSREITDQKRLERELRAAKDELRRRADRLEETVTERTAQLTQSVKYLEDLNYTIAHDLRAPIRAMQAFATALIEDVPLDDTGTLYAQRIEGAAIRMDQLVNDLLEYSELTHSEVPILLVDLNTVIQNVLGQLANDINEVRAQIEVRSPLPVILADKTLMEKILTNLLLNALKFVFPEAVPRILIRAEHRESTVRLWVEDQGIGIASVYHEKVFGVFQRLHTTEEFPGTGIGLAIIKRAAARMGATVGLESESGQGSKFWIDVRMPA